MLCSSNVFRKLPGFEMKYFNSLYSDDQSAGVFSNSCSYFKMDINHMWDNNMDPSEINSMEGNLSNKRKPEISAEFINNMDASEINSINAQLGVVQNMNSCNERDIDDIVDRINPMFLKC